jgi:hypothetical protein
MKTATDKKIMMNDLCCDHEGFLSLSKKINYKCGLFFSDFLFYTIFGNFIFGEKFT